MNKICVIAAVLIVCSCANTGNSASKDSEYSQGTAVSDQREDSTFRAYSIGETGPAGGIIFYDKRSNSSGWRYLEAAPKDAEFLAAWSYQRTNVSDTKSLIGSGSQNTRLIANKLRGTEDEVNAAALKVFNLEYNGFKDWFMPSQAELDQMYGNLKRKDIGSFMDDMYWVSDDANYEGFKTGVQNFTNGEMDYSAKENAHYVRPIRQVPGPNPPPVNTAASSGIFGSGKIANVFKNSVVSTVFIVLAIGTVMVLMIFLPGNSSNSEAVN